MLIFGNRLIKRFPSLFLSSHSKLQRVSLDTATKNTMPHRKNFIHKVGTLKKHTHLHHFKILSSYLEFVPTIFNFDVKT